jgi:hypothetical protein
MLKKLVLRTAHKVGYDIVPLTAPPGNVPPPPELVPADFETVALARRYSMTSDLRLYALIKACRYVATHKIPGDIVECGVWRGGSMLTAARTLVAAGDSIRELYLYDTFEGMSAPTDEDIDPKGNSAADLLKTSGRDSIVHAFAPLDIVKEAMGQTTYPADRIHYVKGKVEETIPAVAPDRIAILRLDTDWYESTRHELHHLFPRLVPGGVLIIDDYGHWQGARKAVDEFFRQPGQPPMLLNIIDETGRIGIKIA